jgi:hypothetical protein
MFACVILAQLRNLLLVQAVELVLDFDANLRGQSLQVAPIGA